MWTQNGGEIDYSGIQQDFHFLCFHRPTKGPYCFVNKEYSKTVAILYSAEFLCRASYELYSGIVYLSESVLYGYLMKKNTKYVWNGVYIYHQP